MRKLSVLLIATVSTLFVYSQRQVNWSYIANKIADKVYEVRVIATIQPGWYIYAHHQPHKSIGQPTEIAFSKNPLINPADAVKEEGKLIKKRFNAQGIESNTYLDTVTFTQHITLKADAKTVLEGTVLYQACNAHLSMPPDSLKFLMMLQ